MARRTTISASRFRSAATRWWSEPGRHGRCQQRPGRGLRVHGARLRLGEHDPDRQAHRLRWRGGRRSRHIGFRSAATRWWSERTQRPATRARPTCSDTPAVASAVSTTAAANSRYKVGGTVPITVTFSEPVNVTGTPQLTLNDGGVANYASGGGTRRSPSTTRSRRGRTRQTWTMPPPARCAQGGSIKDLAGNAATLTLPARHRWPGDEEHRHRHHAAQRIHYAGADGDHAEHFGHVCLHRLRQSDGDGQPGVPVTPGRRHVRHVRQPGEL